MSGAIPPEAKAPSAVPVLGEGLQQAQDAETTSPTSPIATNTSTGGTVDTVDSKDPKKRHFWQFAKKKEDKKKVAAASSTATSHPTPTHLTSDSPMARSPSPSSPRMAPSSPGRIQSSPRVASPASSQIFERNVQEDVVAAGSPAIPSHIATENHIPPVLDASSHAITDDHLDPDTVEIVTHASHQPAAELITSGTDPSLPPLSTQTSDDGAAERLSPITSTMAPLPIPATQILHGEQSLSESGETGSNYGTLDSNDVRRLSFISFADVVHAEQAASSGDHTSMRDSLLVSPGPTSAMASPINAARSPSPIRSPISPPLSTGSASPQLHSEGSPPPASRIATSPRVGASLGSKGLGLGVGSASPPATQGQLSVETMTQALRKTGSGELNASEYEVGKLP